MHQKGLLFIAICCLSYESIANANLIVEWSSWTECSSVNGSTCLSRTLNCRTESTSWQKCRQGNSSVEEQLLNCTGCNGTWINPNDTKGSCVASCCNSSRWRTSACSSSSACVRRSRTPCNDLSLCAGVWTTTAVSKCDATCRANGTQLLSQNCIKDNQLSVECAGSYGLIKQRNITKACTNIECNGWSEWFSTAACSQSCGGGMRYFTRRCLNNDTCSEPKGFQMSTQPCNNHTCPTWTTWSVGDLCMNNLQAISRVCLYLESVHSDCNGSNGSIFQTSLQACHSTSNRTMNSDPNNCDSILLSFTIPLIAGLLVCFGILVTVLILFRKRCYKKSSHNDDSGTAACFDKQKRSLHSHREFNTKSGNEENNKHNKNAYKMSKNDSFISHNNLNRRNSHCSGPHLSSLETSTEEHLNDLNANVQSRLNNTEFHRFASFPDILQNEQQDKIPSQNDQLTIKQRPSVRRAARLKKKEQQREKRMMRRRPDEADGPEWRRTQTMRQITSKENELQSCQKVSTLSNHKKAHSAGSLLESGYSPTSFTPLKPTRRSTTRLQDSSEILQRKQFSANPTKLKRNSLRKLNPPVICCQEPYKDLSTVGSTLALPRGRSRSEGNLFQPSSLALDSFIKTRANSTIKNAENHRDLRNANSLSRPHKPRRNPSFSGASFQGDPSSFQPSYLLHPNSTLDQRIGSGYHSSRSLQSVAEDTTAADGKDKHKSMPVE